MLAALTAIQQREGRKEGRKEEESKSLGICFSLLPFRKLAKQSPRIVSVCSAALEEELLDSNFIIFRSDVRSRAAKDKQQYEVL